MTLQTSPSTIARLLGGRAFHDAALTADLHIIDQLIHERSLKLSRHPLWPLMRPILFRMFHYDEALPTGGSFIIAPNHPTGIADGIAVFDALKNHRPDMAIFANRDALRVAAGFRDLIIPVEWRAGEKSHAKSRDTLSMTARAFGDGKAVVLFPSGRIAYWNEGTLTERPWQSSAVALARRYEVPIVPTHITARNSGLFYFLAKHSTELRDMTVFHELLNKKKFGFTITFGKPIPHSRLVGEPADVTAALQAHTVHRLRDDPQAVFEALPPIR